MRTAHLHHTPSESLWVSLRSGLLFLGVLAAVFGSATLVIVLLTNLAFSLF